MAPGAGPAALLAALDGLGEQVTELRLPLAVAGAEPARRLQREISDQLTDYVLPRLRRLDAPLLAVVGGPTGAGKSTLVNSLVGKRVSASGVIRPTTRSAVLAYHPNDNSWFEEERVLPGLKRSTLPSTDPSTIQLVPSEGIPAGIAVLDAPDIDSVVTRNRDAGDPAAGRRGHVAVRHDGRALRRRRARGSSCGRRSPAAPLWRSSSTGCRRRRRGGARPPRQHADRARTR